MKGAVAKKAKMRPLLSISETRMKQGMKSATELEPQRSREGKPVVHSRFNAARSDSYHKQVDRMNPTKTRPARRLFPGLVN
jgi:hypothetical protein